MTRVASTRSVCDTINTRPAVDRPIEGIDEIHALTLISELGADFTKWPTVKHFTSWLGLCPNWKKTGGKVQSSQTRKGKNRAASALRLAAGSLVRSPSYLGAYLRRQRARLGAPKAERLEKQLQRRAKELGYELKRIPETVTMPDGEIVNA